VSPESSPVPHSLKIEYLDGLRGLAALMVVFAHFRDLRLPPIVTDAPVSFLDFVTRTPLMLLLASHIAVRIFFMHSGFVLTWKYFHSGDYRILMSMAARRIFRLGIPIFASVLFAFVLMRLGWMQNSAAAVKALESPLRTAYTFNPTLSSAVRDALGGWLFRQSFRYNGALWTMPIELVCSYLVFAGAPLLRRGTKPAVLGAGTLLSLALLPNHAWTAYFVAGAIFARLKRDEPELGTAWSARHRSISLPILVAALMAAPWPFLSASAVAPGISLAPELVQFACVIVIFWSLLTTPHAQSFFGSRPLRFMGRTSFAVYLLHFPLICSLGSALYLFWSPRLTSAAVFILTVLPTIAVLYILGDVASRTIDRFAIDFGKRFLERQLWRTKPAS